MNSLYEVDYLVSPSNEKWCEDRLILGDSLWGIIDGVTPINSYPFLSYNSPAEWMAEEFVKFTQDSSGNSDSDFKDVCVRFIEKTAKKPELQVMKEWEKPCFTCAAVSIHNNHLHCYVLGDCNIYLKLKDGSVKYFSDHRAEAFSTKTKIAKIKALNNGSDMFQAIRKQRILNSKSMNMPGGYWTVGYRGNFLKQFIEKSLPKSEVVSFLLCSDGFDRLFNSFELLKPDQLLEKEISLHQALNCLRLHERTSDEQVKKSDDASALLLSFKETLT